MSELIDLLNHWTELEPERCEPFAWDEPNRNQFKILTAPANWWGFDAEDADGGDLAYLQSAVQRAIVSHNIRFSLENAADGLHFAGVRGVSQHSTCLAQDKEPALALLKAYLAWLEKRVEVTQVTAGGGSET